MGSAGPIAARDERPACPSVPAAREYVSVGAADPGGKDWADVSARVTLGDIVFADRKPFTSECEWVALVRSIAARDARALHSLYQRMHHLVFTVIVRIARDRQAAEELTLDVFHDVWRRAPAYDPAKGSVVGWVMNQARSRAIDRQRFEQRKKRVDGHPRLVGAEDDVTGPHQALELQERARLLRDALAALTPAERQAIELAFFRGLTHAETADGLDEPLGTVKSRIRSAIEKLRRTLGVEGEP